MKAGGIIREKRKEIGWSQRDLADRVGVSQVAIKKIETGETVKSKHFPKIAQLLGIDLAEIDPALSSNSISTGVNFPRAGTKAPLQRFEQEQLTGRHDLPVFGTAQGGPGVLVLSSQPFRVISRPHNLQGIENAFGILIIGNSMFPEYREGDIAYVDPHSPPRAGDACLFQSERNGDVEAMIKYLDKSPHSSDDVWHVRQQTPERKFTLKKADWQKCYVLVGKQSGR
jgi:transcriptional regulator with XRE-family HTH domain